MRPQRRELARYHRQEGVEIGREGPAALHVKVGGYWTYVPLSVIHSKKRGPAGSIGQDELVVHEWFAKSRGWC